MNDRSEIDLRNRPALSGRLEGAVFDLLVIGGGITGAGVARDAAMRGLSVALIERRDFASGTSSRSSKMVHGGLRYLAQGEIGLVREAASERKILNAIAPHLAQPATFILPAGTSGAAAKLKAALWAFDRLGGVSARDRHRYVHKAELGELEPLLRTDAMHGAFAYREYLTDDSRLTLANVRSANAHGAIAANYVEAREIRGGDISEIIARSTLVDDEWECRIRARSVVNAAGPWVDEIRQAEDSGAPDRLALSKGVHIVVARDKLPLTHTAIIHTPDKRAIFAVPRGAFAYIGTTDTFYPDRDYWPRVENSDVDYLLDAAKSALHADSLCKRDIISVWSGVRPLVRQDGKSASDISRKDEIWTGPQGVLSIAGGKLSAYRSMAERIVDQVISRRGLKAPACATADEPLPGGEAQAQANEAIESLGPVAAERLLRLYGAEAEIVAGSGGDVAAEARRAVLAEGAVRLEDYWVRRSARAWFDDNAGLEALEPAAREMAALLGWSQSRRELEIEHCRNIDRMSKSGIAE